MKRFALVLCLLGIAGAAVYLRAWSNAEIQAPAFDFAPRRGAAYYAALDGTLEGWLKRQGFTRVPEGFGNPGIFASTSVVVDKSEGYACSVHWSFRGPKWLLDARRKDAEDFLAKLTAWCEAYEAGLPRPR